MNGIHRLSAVFALAVVLVLPLQAQIETPSEPETVVVVTAEKTSQPASESIASTTVITARQIQEQGAQTVADVLRLVPGVTLRQSGETGTKASAHIRGVKSEQVLVLIDGKRITSPAFVTTDLSKVSTMNVSRIEVIRGPVSSLYGSEAIGGVVNIITKRPTSGSGSALYSIGDDGRGDSSLSLQGVDDRMSWQLACSTPTYSGERPNSEFSATDLSVGLSLPSVRGWDLSLNGDQYQDSLGLPGADYDHTGFYDPDDHQWYERRGLDLTAKKDVGAGQLEMRVYRISQLIHYFDPGFSFDWQTHGTTDAAEATYHIERGKHRIVVGSEIRSDDYHEFSTYSDVQKSVSNLALFMQDRWAVSDRTDVVLGTRLDDHSAAGRKLTPRIGMSYALATRTKLRISYAEGFRAPDFVELYYPDLGNPLLKPEKSRQYEVGLNVERGRSSFDLAVFDSTIRDMINNQVRPYENTAKAGQRGIELSWARRLSDSSTFSLSYTYVDATDRVADARLPGLPHNHLTMAISGAINTWRVGLACRTTDSRPDKAYDPITYESRDVSVPGHAVFDLTLTREGAGRSNPYVVVRNLFNTAYEEVYGYPTEGISIEAGMRTGW